MRCCCFLQSGQSQSLAINEKAAVGCRVPLTDGQLYVRALKGTANPPEVSVIVFPEDTHALDRPQTEFEQWLNIAAWLKEHLGARS